MRRIIWLAAIPLALAGCEVPYVAPQVQPLAGIPIDREGSPFAELRGVGGNPPPATLDPGPVPSSPIPIVLDNPSPPPPRRHYRRSPVTRQPDDESPVTVAPPRPQPTRAPPEFSPEPPPEPGQPGLLDNLRDRLRGLLAPSQPANGDDCAGAWRICHFL